MHIGPGSGPSAAAAAAAASAASTASGWQAAPIWHTCGLTPGTSPHLVRETAGRDHEQGGARPKGCKERPPRVRGDALGSPGVLVLLLEVCRPSFAPAARALCGWPPPTARNV